MKSITVNSFLKKQIPKIMISTLFLALSAASSIVFAFILAYIIESALNLEIQDFYTNSILALVLILVSIILQIIGDNIRKNYAYKAVVNYKNTLLDKVFSFDFKSYINNSEAYYLNLLTEESKLIGTNYYMQIASIMQNLIQLLLGIGALLFISWKFFLAVLLLSFISMIVPVIISNILGKKVKIASKNNERYLSYLKSILGGFELIKSFSIKDKIVETFSSVNKKKEHSQYEVGVVENVRNAASKASSFIVQMGAIVIGTYLVFKKDLDIIMLFAGIQVISHIVSPITDLSQRITWVLGTDPIRKKHNEILSGDSIVLNPSAIIIEGIDSLELENISFAYNESGFVLDNISYRFDKKRKYAIIGESGSGKSTIMKLMMGYYQDYAGNLRINGRNYRDACLESIYDHISIMHQNVVMFEDTFENNIKLFRQVDEDLYEDIIKRTNLTELSQRFSKEDAKLSFDNISEISGGEKQRIAIARSILAKPDAVLFDEAASALDPQNTGMIYDMLFGMEDVLFIAVTHNWEDALMNRFDEVLYIEKGRIMHSGSWDTVKELLHHT